MAKEPRKTTAFGTSPDSFSESRRRRDADNSTHDYTHNPTHGDVVEPQAKERKRKRVQLLTYESLIERMDAYATRKGVSRVDVFETAVTSFLDKVEGVDS